MSIDGTKQQALTLEQTHRVLKSLAAKRPTLECVDAFSSGLDTVGVDAAKGILLSLLSSNFLLSLEEKREKLLSLLSQATYQQH